MEFDHDTWYMRRRDAIEEDSMLGTVLISRLVVLPAKKGIKSRFLLQLLDDNASPQHT